jgi:hypothetical protein
MRDIVMVLKNFAAMATQAENGLELSVAAKVAAFATRRNLHYPMLTENLMERVIAGKTDDGIYIYQLDLHRLKKLNLFFSN